MLNMQKLQYVRDVEKSTITRNDFCHMQCFLWFTISQLYFQIISEHVKKIFIKSITWLNVIRDNLAVICIVFTTYTRKCPAGVL